MTKKNKATLLLLSILSIFSMTFYYSNSPWYNIKIGIVLTTIAFLGTIALVFLKEQDYKKYYIIIGMCMLLILAQLLIK